VSRRGLFDQSDFECVCSFHFGEPGSEDRAVDKAEGICKARAFEIIAFDFLDQRVDCRRWSGLKHTGAESPKNVLLGDLLGAAADLVDASRSDVSKRYT
jgi:hypothetical protein